MTLIRARGGDSVAQHRLISLWRRKVRSGSPQSPTRYPWPLTSRHVAALPPWIPPRDDWRPWRPAEAAEYERDPNAFEARLLVPIVLTEAADWLASVADGGAPERDDAIAMLSECMPALRRDYAFYVSGRHAWGDTFALWCLARRPSALRRFHPFALAIADGYGDAARAANGVGLGSRFPFHDRPLVSVSAQLASGLLALGLQPELIGALASFVAAEQSPSGGWADADGPVDPLTTLVALELLVGLDPSFNPAPALDALERMQGADGWWRALGPETAWLTRELVVLVGRCELPFADRFNWPHLTLEHLDRRTGLPFLSYLQGVVALGAKLPRLGVEEVDVAFIDLVGFGAWNNALGMERGDALLAALANELRTIPGALAVRDGGDEFLLVGRPTALGLVEQLETFRRAWPGRLRATLGDVPDAALRIVVTRAPMSGLIAARDELGRAMGPLKESLGSLPAEGALVVLDAFA
jgi:GGDEF domain-containing protein